MLLTSYELLSADHLNPAIPRSILLVILLTDCLHVDKTGDQNLVLHLELIPALKLKSLSFYVILVQGSISKFKGGLT